MPTFDDVLTLDATAQAALVRRGEVSPLHLVDAALEAIGRVNPRLNLVVTRMDEQARAAASGPLPDGPFRGVPFLLKDLLTNCAGVRTSAGSRMLRDFVPDHDSELVRRLKAAGLIIVGKTNTPEFGLLPTTEPLLFGPARNPWDPTRSTGGSSGGAAAAVAARLVPMAHGNDGGGSIRIPAACCGVFGLKPTRGRLTLGPDIGDIMGGLVVEHALTRSVRDSAALLDATAGPMAGDPYWPAAPERPFAEAVHRPPGRIRIAFTTRPLLPVPIDEACVKAVRDAARRCAELGHDVEEASPSLESEAFAQAFIVVWAAGCALSVEGLSRAIGRPPGEDGIEPFTRALREVGRGLSSTDYLLAQLGLQSQCRIVGRFFERYDVWLTPVTTSAAPPLGTFDATSGDALDLMLRAAAFVPFTGLANATGQPAMSMPLAWTPEGLPIGVQAMGRYGDEATLLGLAAQLEEVERWAERVPPIWGGEGGC